MGHKVQVSKPELFKRIREQCIECHGGVVKGPDSPEGCNLISCSLWGFRLGEKKVPKELPKWRAARKAKQLYVD
jgi:hypothetical protein